MLTQHREVLGKGVSWQSGRVRGTKRSRGQRREDYCVLAVCQARNEGLRNHFLFIIRIILASKSFPHGTAEKTEALERPRLVLESASDKARIFSGLQVQEKARPAEWRCPCAQGSDRTAVARPCWVGMGEV